MVLQAFERFNLAHVVTVDVVADVIVGRLISFLSLACHHSPKYQPICVPYLVRLALVHVPPDPANGLPVEVLQVSAQTV